jgi:hypothetical protein
MVFLAKAMYTIQMLLLLLELLSIFTVGELIISLLSKSVEISSTKIGSHFKRDELFFFISERGGVRK